jgi:rubredoxin
MSEKNLVYLKDLVRFRDDVVKLRVSLGNRIGAKKNGSGWVFLKRYTICKNKHAVLLKEDEKRDRCPLCGEPVQVVEETPSNELIQRFYDLLKQQETVEGLLAGVITQFPEFTNFLAFIRGIGPANAARLIVYAFPPQFGYNANKFRSYAGLAVMFQCPKCGYWYYAGKSSNGKPATPSKEGWLCPVDGTKLIGTAAKNVPYNREVKTFLLGILANNLMMAGGVYSKIIKSFKEDVAAKHPDWPKLRVQRTATRKAISLLISQLFAISLYYREGVPLHKAYEVVLGKEYKILKEHEDFIEAPITDYYVDIKSDKYKAKFEKVVEELGIDKNEVITWLKKKKVIQ